MKVALIVVLLTAIPCGAQDGYFSLPFASQPIDLNQPGAMEKLRAKRPEHYKKIDAILQHLPTIYVQDVPGYLRVHFNATHVFYTETLLTSLPPQRDLSFVLDDTTYQARVTLDHGGATIYPVKNR